MDEIKNNYIALKQFGIANNIDVLHLIKILEMYYTERKFTIPDGAMMDRDWVCMSDDKTHLVLTKKALALFNVSKIHQDVPKLTKKSGEFVKELAERLYKNKGTVENLTRLQKYIKNPLALPFFLLFLELFPTADKQKNRDWESLFGEYNGVTLRKVSEGTAKNLRKYLKLGI